MAKDFVTGACLGALISTFFFPLNVVKTRLQTQLGGQGVRAWDMAWVVYEERGRKMRHLFKVGFPGFFFVGPLLDDWLKGVNSQSPERAFLCNHFDACMYVIKLQVTVFDPTT